MLDGLAEYGYWGLLLASFCWPTHFAFQFGSGFCRADSGRKK